MGIGGGEEKFTPTTRISLARHSFFEWIQSPSLGIRSRRVTVFEGMISRPKKKKKKNRARVPENMALIDNLFFFF